MKRISNAYQLPSILLVLVLALSTAVHAQDASGWKTLDANKIKNVGLREKYTYHNMCHVASWMECDASVLIDRMWKKELTDYAFARGYAYPFHSRRNLLTMRLPEAMLIHFTRPGIPRILSSMVSTKLAFSTRPKATGC